MASPLLIALIIEIAAIDDPVSANSISRSWTFREIPINETIFITCITTKTMLMNQA
jgi:hypothetical protein